MRRQAGSQKEKYAGCKARRVTNPQTRRSARIPARATLIPPAQNRFRETNPPIRLYVPPSLRTPSHPSNPTWKNKKTETTYLTFYGTPTTRKTPHTPRPAPALPTKAGSPAATAPQAPPFTVPRTPSPFLHLPPRPRPFQMPVPVRPTWAVTSHHAHAQTRQQDQAGSVDRSIHGKDGQARHGTQSSPGSGSNHTNAEKKRTQKKHGLSDKNLPHGTLKIQTSNLAIQSRRCHTAWCGMEAIALSSRHFAQTTSA